MIDIKKELLSILHADLKDLIKCHEQCEGDYNRYAIMMSGYKSQIKDIEHKIREIEKEYKERL